MATSKTAAIQKPIIQINDEIREMTDEEFAFYKLIIADSEILPTGE